MRQRGMDIPPRNSTRIVRFFFFFGFGPPPPPRQNGDPVFLFGFPLNPPTGTPEKERDPCSEGFGFATLDVSSWSEKADMQWHHPGHWGLVMMSHLYMGLSFFEGTPSLVVFKKNQKDTNLSFFWSGGGGGAARRGGPG